MKFIIAVILAFSTIAFSQELNCKVSLNLDNIPISNRDLLSGFDRAVSDYMNKTRFSNSDWQNDRIDCGMNILILTASNDGNFSAQVVVTSQRPVYKSEKNLQVLRINDANWSFTYQKGQALVSNQSSFDPLASFLDYYADIIIGFNEDSWEEFGGTPYFNRAFNIDNLAISSNFSKGWSRSGLYSRQALVEDILNDKYRPFREAYYQYYYGIDYYVNVDKKKGQKKIVETIQTIASLQNKIDLVGSIVLRTFFDANSGEIVNYLSDYSDKSIFQLLKKIDPQHTAKYDAAYLAN